MTTSCFRTTLAAAVAALSLGAVSCATDASGAANDPNSVGNPNSASGLLTNGDLESGDSSGWKISGSSEVTEGAKINGKYGLRMLTAANSNTTAAQTTVTSLAANQSYTVSAKT